ncbi:MAG: 30S ribosomal protein S20 [Desulfobacteraceae bacterium]
MANHKSALKRARQNEVRRMRNKSLKSMIKTLDKKVRSAKDAGEDKVDDLYRDAQSAIHKAAKKNVIHKNAAARKISSLSRYVNA